MKKINVKMFGKYSLSTLFFVLSISCLGFLIVQTIKSQFFSDFTLNGVYIESSFLLNTVVLFRNLAVIVPLALIFNALRKEVIFTKNTLKSLNFFTVFNLLVPLAYILIDVFINDLKLSGIFNASILHIVLAAFSIFITAIFKQGFQIQQENDLTI